MLEVAPFGDAPPDLPALRASVVGWLHDEVAAMNLDNFVVRPKRRLVERYATPKSWNRLSDDDRRRMNKPLQEFERNASRRIRKVTREKIVAAEL